MSSIKRARARYYSEKRRKEKEFDKILNPYPEKVDAFGKKDLTYYNAMQLIRGGSIEDIVLK